MANYTYVHETVPFIALSHIEGIEFRPLKNNIAIKIKSILFEGTKKEYREKKGKPKEERPNNDMGILVTYYTIAITSTQNTVNVQMLHIIVQTWQFC